MWLIDLNTGGTVYAWGGGTVAVNPSSTLPVITALQYQLQVGVTPMPFPTQQLPFLLNFGGAEPQFTIEWLINDKNNYTGTAAGDWNLLTNVANWGGNVAGYQLYLPEVSPAGSTISVQCFTFQLSLNYVGGQVNVYTASMTVYAGIVI